MTALCPREGQRLGTVREERLRWPRTAAAAAAARGCDRVFLFDRATFLETGESLWQEAPLGVTTTSVVTLSQDGGFWWRRAMAPAASRGTAYRVDDSAN